MSQKTNIEWTGFTWNPVRGCLRVDSACKNCYAETIAGRFCGPGQPYEGLVKKHITNHGTEPRWNNEIKLVPEKLHEPLRWRKPRVVFVNSMSDLFHDKVPDDYIVSMFAVMAMAYQHTFQILTKRTDRMYGLLSNVSSTLPAIHKAARQIKMPGDRDKPDTSWPFKNIWLGVSIGIRESLARIEALRQTPAAVRFISFEPLLEDLGDLDLTGIHWIIIGGESGPGARPMETAWAESIYRQARNQGVAVFIKQHSEYNYPRKAYKSIDCFPDYMRAREFPDAEKIANGRWWNRFNRVMA